MRRSGAASFEPFSMAAADALPVLVRSWLLQLDALVAVELSVLCCSSSPAIPEGEKNSTPC